MLGIRSKSPLLVCKEGNCVICSMYMNTLAKQTRPTLKQLAAEVRLLRSAVIGLIGRDPEGEYNPEFVQRALANAAEKPSYTFTTPEAFLADLKRL